MYSHDFKEHTTLNKCSFLTWIFFKSTKTTSNHVLNYETPPDAFLLKSRANLGSLLFSTGPKIFMGIMRCEAKLIVMILERRQNYYLQIVKVAYQSEKNKTVKNLNCSEVVE